MTRYVLVILALCSFATAQHTSTATTTPAAPVVMETESYPFPLAERDKIRDIQHEYDQIEIDNQKMLVKIEQNKALQSALNDKLKLAAFQFGQSKKIDFEQYDFLPGPINFTKKQPAK